MSIKIYNCEGSRGVRPIWTLEEMGVDYEVEMLPFPPRVFKPEYLEVNILGTIPYLEDGDVRMTESVPETPPPQNPAVPDPAGPPGASRLPSTPLRGSLARPRHAPTRRPPGRVSVYGLDRSPGRRSGRSDSARR